MGVLQGLVSYSGTMYAAWKGEPGDDRIFFSSSTTPNDWAGPEAIPGTTSAGPCLSPFGSSLYAGWKGEWSDPRLFISSFDTQWHPPAQIPGAYSDTGPAICQFGDKLLAAWKNVFDDVLMFATYDGADWTVPATMGGGSSVGPALANFNGQLFAAYKGASHEQLWYAIYANGSWTQQQIPQAVSSVGPSLAVVGDALYAVWKGGAGDDGLHYASYRTGTGNVGTWSTQTASPGQIPGVGSSVGAAITAFDDHLYAMWKGEEGDGGLSIAEFTGPEWSVWNNVIPGNTGPDTYTPLPAPTTGNTNYLLADSGGTGTAITGATVTIIVVDEIVPDGTEDYSFQINCQSPASSTAFVWQQYGWRIAENQLFFWINNFLQAGLPADAAIDWDSRPPRLPGGAGVMSVPNNRLPKGLQLTSVLATDSAGRVVGVAFDVTDAAGDTLLSQSVTLQEVSPAVGAEDYAEIQTFQVVMVGENGGSTTDFSAGRGIFHCAADNSLVATVAQDETGEGSNVEYSPLPAAYANGDFYQPFGVGKI